MSVKRGAQHPAIEYLFAKADNGVHPEEDTNRYSGEHTTSVSLSRALAVGCLSRLDTSQSSVDIWDPAVGSGFAGSLVLGALQSAGVQARYRGQDINASAVEESRRRFEGVADVEIAQGNTLAKDAFEHFMADLVIVDPPWGVSWTGSASAVEARQQRGEFSYGLPQKSDSTWLFISLAFEKLRPTEEGGGRIAALVNPSALWAGGASGAVRRRIVEAGLLESVTRLPDGLAPNTSIPLYLATFTNRSNEVMRGKAMIADLRTQFTTERRHRSMPIAAFRELESGLRTGKPGPRNRTIAIRQFTRREARLARVSSEGRELSWRLTTYNDTSIDSQFLDSRYGPDSGVSIAEEPREVIDLDPSRIFGDDAREILKDIETHGWAGRRLSSLLAREPESLTSAIDSASERRLFVPTTREGRVAAESGGTGSDGRILSIQLDGDQVEPTFLAAWLNSEQGVSSRRRAVKASSSGLFQALRSDTASLMRWADELVVPVPDRSTQLALASADEQLGSFQAMLSGQRENIWSAPESAEDVVNAMAHAFDDSVSAWLDQLPFPIASALWTAETAASLGAQQRAYIHAWEAIVTFHATVLLSASRSDPGSSSEVEAAIRQTLQDQNLGIERASFGTWVIIIERTSSGLRRALEKGDADEVARIRRAFGDLTQTGVERLISKSIVNKFKEVNVKRNRWLGHTGFTSDEAWTTQVASLVSDLRDLRQLLGNVWAQLVLVRAGSAKRARGGFVQSAEVAVGTRSPFATRDFSVGDMMMHGELYLVKDGSQSPLRLGHFVQLRAAPPNAQYTTYFYNRTDGDKVHMVSYQYGSDELQDILDNFSEEFGALRLGSSRAK